MSSSEIWAIRQQKIEEKNTLASLHWALTSVVDSLLEVSKILTNAGESMEAAGSLYGKPFDNGKTLEWANNISGASPKVENIANEINSIVESLKMEINQLYTDYSNALKREEQARKYTTNTDAKSNTTAVTNKAAKRNDFNAKQTYRM